MKRWMVWNCCKHKQYDSLTTIACEIIETRTELFILTSQEGSHVFCKKVTAMRVDVSVLLVSTYCSRSRNS